MTNNEIKLEMTKLEKSYEKIKVDIASLLTKMRELDESYIKAKNELINRSKVMTNG